MLPERWLVVPGFSRYRASSLGRIQRIVPPHSKKFGRCMSPRTNWYGYDYVKIVDDNRVARTRYVHHLIAETFIGPRPAGLILHHKDDDKRNNAAANLEYVTRSANSRLAVAAGLWRARSGESHPFAALTRAKVATIKRLLLDGVSQYRIAARFGVSRGAINCIKLGRTWKDVPPAA